MKRQSYSQNGGLRAGLCALGIILFLGIIFLFAHEADITAEHTSSEIEVKLEK